MAEAATGARGAQASWIASCGLAGYDRVVHFNEGNRLPN